MQNRNLLSIVTVFQRLGVNAIQAFVKQFCRKELIKWLTAV